MRVRRILSSSLAMPGVSPKRACDQANPPVAVNQPVIERVAEATAQRRDIVDLVGDGRALGRSSRKDQAILEKLRERNVGFDSEQQPGRQNVIVACLQAAILTVERIARSCRVGIGQRAVRVAQTIGRVPADIEASPVVIRKPVRPELLPPWRRRGRRHGRGLQARSTIQPATSSPFISAPSPGRAQRSRRSCCDFDHDNDATAVSPHQTSQELARRKSAGSGKH